LLPTVARFKGSRRSPAAPRLGGAQVGARISSVPSATTRIGVDCVVLLGEVKTLREALEDAGFHNRRFSVTSLSRFAPSE